MSSKVAPTTWCLISNCYSQSNVEMHTGGLFHDPSVSTASNVFPRFHPGFSFATKLDAEIGENVPLHVTFAASAPCSKVAAAPRIAPFMLATRWNVGLG
jgi:hypothetical protein